MKRLLLFIILFAGLVASAQDTTTQVAVADTAIAKTLPPEPPKPEKPADPAGHTGHAGMWIFLGGLLVVAGGMMYLHGHNSKKILGLREEIEALKETMTKNNDMVSKSMKSLQTQVETLSKKQEEIRIPVQEKEEKPQPLTLYLSRADANGVFSHAAKQFEPGNSFFELHTTTGSTEGTFSVIENPNVHQLALMMPTSNITNACQGPGIHTSGGKTRIVTDASGTATLRAGKWNVTTKAQIHYEA